MQKDTPEQWFINIIHKGLTSILPLRLEGTPPEDTVGATSSIWSRALWKGRVWNEEADSQRIGEAFRQLAISCIRWPSPSAFLEVLPMRGAAPAQTVPVQRQLVHNTKIDERGDAEHRARMLERFNQSMAEHVRSPERIAMLESERIGTVRRGRKLPLPHTDNSIHGEWVPCNSIAEVLARAGARTVV
jgi:hypothetical protein